MSESVGSLLRRPSHCAGDAGGDAQCKTPRRARRQLSKIAAAAALEARASPAMTRRRLQQPRNGGRQFVQGERLPQNRHIPARGKRFQRVSSATAHKEDREARLRCSGDLDDLAPADAGEPSIFRLCASRVSLSSNAAFACCNCATEGIARNFGRAYQSAAAVETDAIAVAALTMKVCVAILRLLFVRPIFSKHFRPGGGACHGERNQL
jgi:hypothetical protein